MLKKSIRRTSLYLLDIITINLTLILALYLHYEGHIPGAAINVYLRASVVLSIGKILIYRSMGLYDSLWEYASIEELIKVIIAVLVANETGAVYLITLGLNVYMGIYFITLVLEILCVGGNRFSYRMVRRIKQQQPLTQQKGVKKVMNIGSCATASMIATEIKNHSKGYGLVVGYVDDD